MNSKKKRLGAAALSLALCVSAAPAALAAPAEAPVTRRMVSEAIWEMEGAPVVNSVLPFTDVDAEAPYAEAVRWAYAQGIVSGVGDGLFLPDEPITRQELAAMLYRNAMASGFDTSAGEDTNILSYTDGFSWSDWAAESVQWAVGAGLLTDSDGVLDAQGYIAADEIDSYLTFYSLMYAAQPVLNLWTEDAPARTALISYMDAITDPTSTDYIPVEDRIAVFDFDGTLFCETDPNYFDYTLLKYRVLEDPDYIEKASDFEKEVANKIKEQNETGASFSGLETDHGKAVASAFSGMTLDEFSDYIQDFKLQPMPSYEGMLRGDGWYLPMLEIVDYLKANDFTVYIVSGTDRLIVRGICENSPIGLPNSQIIGSDERIAATGQGEEDGLKYTFQDGDQLILAGDFLIKNLKMNKVSVIAQEIGQQPVLSFGNSTGDSAMAQYVTSGNPYRSLAFMLCCDDNERENGNETKAQKMYDECESHNWIAVSMKNDWTTIYGPDVTYLG